VIWEILKYIAFYTALQHRIQHFCMHLFLYLPVFELREYHGKHFWQSWKVVEIFVQESGNPVLRIVLLDDGTFTSKVDRSKLSEDELIAQLCKRSKITNTAVAAAAACEHASTGAGKTTRSEATRTERLTASQSPASRPQALTKVRQSCVHVNISEPGWAYAKSRAW